MTAKAKQISKCISAKKKKKKKEEEKPNERGEQKSEDRLLAVGAACAAIF